MRLVIIGQDNTPRYLAMVIVVTALLAAENVKKSARGIIPGDDRVCNCVATAGTPLLLPSKLSGVILVKGKRPSLVYSIISAVDGGVFPINRTT